MPAPHKYYTSEDLHPPLAVITTTPLPAKMRPQVLEDSFFKLPDDVPFYEGQEEYVRVKESLVDYHIASRDLRSAVIECSKYLVANPGTSLIHGAADGDGEKRLEIAIRLAHSYPILDYSVITLAKPIDASAGAQALLKSWI
jgi:hypothetical protein